MNPRARKKEPPDLLFPLFALPIASHLLNDLALLLLLNRFPLPAIPFPCPFLDFSLSSVTSFYQIGSPPQLVVGIPSTTRRFRSRPYSTMNRRIFWTQVLGGCGGFPGSTRSPGGRLDFTAEQNFPAGGPSLAIDGCCCQDRCICSESRASFCPASLRPTQFLL
uniref:Uncharacterized protein n=1 Tax=Opuntia streptacantha TaxID=393608 RepID=A0A7C9DHX7_OPUST